MTVATLYVTKDATGAQTSINGTTGTLSNSTVNNVQAGISSSCSGSTPSQACLMADMSSIPTNMTVTSSSFSFYVTSHGTSTASVIELFKATSSWVETDGTTGPTYDSSSPSGLGITNNFPTNAYFTASPNNALTTWVQGWVSTPANNFGVILTSDFFDGNGWITLNTREATGTTTDPYWSVTYGFTPTVTAPADNTTVNLTTAAPTFTWTIASGQTQSSFAFRRRAHGSGTYEWWSGSAWVTTETWISSSTLAVNPTWASPESTYYWSVNVTTVSGIVGFYTAERALNPYEYWNGAAWVFGTDVDLWVTTSNPDITVPASGFALASYYWTARAMDSTGKPSAYATDISFLVGGLIERWGFNFI